MKPFLSVNPHRPAALLSLAVFFTVLTLTLAPPAGADWPNANPTKYVQYPETSSMGLDVLASRDLSGQPNRLGDDFPCTVTGPITDIHIWGSWLSNLVDTAPTFEVSIFTDQPATPTQPSMPAALVWSQVFGPGQYVARQILTGMQEGFYVPKPRPGTIVGYDTQIWQYNFYPTNPFVQQGSAANPQVYWVVVSCTSATGRRFGWKTSATHWNDDGVYYGPPEQGEPWLWHELRHPQTQMSLDLAFAITTSDPCPPPAPPPPPPPPETNVIKFIQPPNPMGFDVRACGPVVLADDFLCTNSRPVTDIHLWTSWLNDNWVSNTPIWLAIYSDVPRTNAAFPSHPGQLLWQQWFSPGDYQPYFASDAQEQFLDPSVTNFLGADTWMLFYSFYPTNPFVQTGTPEKPMVYWLVMHAPVPTNCHQQFGWKTSVEHWNDAAVWGPWSQAQGVPTGPWQVVSVPGMSEPVDLAFYLTTEPCPPPPPLPPQPPPETNAVKWLQRPNPTGFDILACRSTVLADDFLCTNRGPVTDIHLWASWLDDYWAANAPVWLGIYTDVPRTNALFPSHPGQLKWAQWFQPGSYQVFLDGTANERFYDPTTTNLLGFDHQMFYYTFYPTNPFAQDGTLDKPIVYWLAAYAAVPTECNPLFGWKTSIDLFNDAPVWGHWLSGQGPMGDWTEIANLFGEPASLAFKLTTTVPTPTNCVRVVCPTGATVVCAPASGAVVNYTAYATNFCTGGLVPVNCVPPSGSLFPPGTTQVCCTNITPPFTNFCCFPVTVLRDTNPPSITCPANLTFNTDSNQCSKSNVIFTVTVSDDCQQPVNVTCTPPSGSTFPKGGTTVTCVATDQGGNTRNCSFTVTVNDTQAPGISCPNSLTAGTDPGLCSKSNVTFTVGVSDNCPGATLTCLPASGTTFPVGATTVTCVATDTSGNVSRCTFTVTINDGEAPGVTCPADLMFNADPGQCSKSNVTFTATATDNCPGVSVTCNPPSGSTFPVGGTLVVCTATDAAGNIAACNFTVSVFGTLPPPPPPPPTETNAVKWIQWPNPVGLDVLDCQQVVLADDFLCTNRGPITDIHLWTSWLRDRWSTNIPIWLGLFSDVPKTNANFPSHPGALLWQQWFRPSDYQIYLAGTASEQFLDPQAMQVLGPDTQMFYYTFYPTNPFVQTGSATQPIVYWLAAYAVVPTNCDLLFGWKSAVEPWNDAPVWGHWLQGQGVPVGDWKAIEGAAAPLPGLAFKLTTPQPPTPTNCVRVICPTNMTVNCAGPNGAVVNYQAYATNVCTGAVLPVNCVPPSGSFFPPGTTQVCCTNITPPWTNFCCFQVTVNRDTNPPTITCPANLVLNADPGTCAKSNVVYGPPSVSDDCPPITVSCAPPSGATFPVGVTTVTCTATDSSGLSASCNFTVTIVGTLPPPPPPPPLETNAVKWVQWPNPNGFDVLDCQQIVLADDFLCTNRGPITDIHLWTSWLRDRWSTNIPIWLGLFSDVPKTNANFPSHPGQLLWQQWFRPSDYQIYLAGTASEQFLDPQAMQVLGPDTQMFYYTFYPTNPFVQTGSATQPIVYWLAAYAVVPTNCDLLFGWKTTITSWNDAPVWGHWMHGQGVPVGDWKAIEGAAAPLPGLAFKLTTPQSPTPTNCVRVICPTNMTVNCAGPNGAVVNYQAYATNDCTGGVLPVTCVPPSGSFFPPGATQVCCTNITPPFTNFCCFQVTVNRDINPPVITCPANLTLNADPGTCAKSNVTFTATATDDCPPITVSCTPPSGSTFPVGVTTVTCMATDAAGLSANCTFTVTIIGTLPPPPPPPPTETNAVKWVQWPNPNGFDVLDCQQIVLADDFLCTNRGPITDIHLWTSWLRDRWSTNIPIWLGLFSDVPKTNANFPSHPGQMLWQQWFGPTDYQIYLAGTASEQFLDPQAMQVLGPDTQMFYYSFYPTNPFVQTGSATQPIVYWLAAYAVVPTNCDLLFGWKTTLTNWNDAPVWGHWMHGQALPLGDWKAIEEALAPLPGLAFKLTTTAPPPPVPTNKVYIQPPDLTTNGLDVRATVPTMLADDFPCTNAGPITNIVIWASWLDDKPNLQARIQLAFWTDVPRTNTFYPSHPGQRLWTDWFAPGTVGASVPGTYEMRPFQTANERFFDPNLAGMNGLIGGDKTVWQINFFPRRAFWQTGTVAQPTVYWLSMAARTTTNTLLLGWKTSQTHWNDDGVFGHVLSSGLPLNDWRELRDPRTSNSLDLSFALLTGASTTTNNPNPDQNLLIKFRQPPDVTDRGLDVRASGLKILADDFYCWRAGRIRGVSVWGSWLNDVVDPNAAFLLGLWSDVPATRTNASHPGSLLASTWFYPPGSTNSAVSRYRYQLEAANLHEQFFDPNVPGIVGNDTQLWRYDFYPSATNWHQTGSPFQRKVYWLSVAAKTTNDTVFGWKTSPMHYNDDAVFGHVNSQWQPQRDWQELRDPRTSNSLDLAFAIKTYRPYALNADFTNTTGKAATSFDVLLSGVHEVIAHFDGYPGAVWPSFRVLYVNGNTLLRWSGLTVPPRGWTHLGFVVTDDAVNPVTMRGWWWDPDGEIIGSPPQVNLVRGNQTLTLWNDVLDPPEPVLIGGLSIEYHETDVPLDDLNPLAASNRHPVRVDEILPPGAAMPIPGGGSLTLPVPVPPERAAYAVHVFQVRSTGTATEGVTTDFIQTPTDWAAMPVIHSAQWSDGVTELTWDTVVGRTYRVQYRDQINESIWHDLPGDVTAEEEVSSFFDVFLTLPSQRHYRILLLP